MSGAARTGAEAVRHPKWEGAERAGSLSPVAAAGGAKAGRRGGLSERGWDQHPRG